MNKKYIKYELTQRLFKKAIQSDSNFYIAAAAFSRNGNLLGYITNGRNNYYEASKRGAGIHAEASLIKRFGKRIDTIYIARTGRNNKNKLPIDPCENCAKIAKNMGIKIIPIHKLPFMKEFYA